MIKKLCTLAFLIAGVWLTASANQEYTITLDKGDNGKQTVDLSYGRVTFEFVTEYSNVARVNVSIENTTPNEAILVFKYNLNENALKRYSPKVEFEKTYPGGKGHRTIKGCKEVTKYVEPIIPAETVRLFTFDASKITTTQLSLPLYLAKFKPKNLLKAGKDRTKYTILAEDIIDFVVTVKIWSESDPQYVQTKDAVSGFIDSLQTVRFCPNKKHPQSLELQQRPYQEKKDSLMFGITEILRTPEWMSTDEPYIAYNALLERLNAVNLDSLNQDCGEHQTGPIVHRCQYCTLSPQQIYHRLDDLYQQQRSGKITRNVAAKQARALYNCYRYSTRRKKDKAYTEKIARFYNRIVK